MERNETRLRRLFDAASEMAREERDGYLGRECAGDSGLRARVEGLLRSLERADDFLVPRPGAVLDNFEAPGTEVGPYRLIEKIGEGGFGVVFLAEQRAPVVRRVALKVIKLGMDTRQVVARFEAERQALAMMGHPNIARVFDAGATQSGRPYFVMEYVQGEPITEYCDRNALTTSERLALFVDICGAIQHAHQKGIIHRDIKPANILVTNVDGKPTPKVIDFGIAKATNTRLTERTLFTAQHQLIGTPQYMSPEQADVAETDVDTRSDIYSLGVLLYELLTGTTPFRAEELRAAAFAEIQRMIREVEPPTPSTRLGTLGAALENVAARRRSRPDELERRLRGDLDWIVMKALEKERERRYETAIGMARDVERHLLDEPVSARPPSRVYRLRKFVRRNRGVVIAAGLAVALLLVGIVGTTAGLVWALDERGRADGARDAARASEAHAQAEAQQAKTMLDVLTEILQPAQTQDEQGKPLPFLERLRLASRAGASRLRDQPESESRVRSVLGSTFAMFEDYAAAEQEYARALELDRALYGDLDPRVVRTVVELARAASSGGSAQRAGEIVRAALARAEALDRPDDPQHAVLSDALAHAQFDMGNLDGAEATAKTTLAWLESHGGREQVAVAENLALLGSIAVRSQHWALARTAFQESIEITRRLLGEFDPNTTERTLGLAHTLRNSGDAAQAIEVLRASVESARESSSGIQSSPAQLATLALRLRRFVTFLGFELDHELEMEAAALESLGIRRRLQDSDSFNLADSLSQVGNVLWIKGEFEQARVYLRESLAQAHKRDDARQRLLAAAVAGMLSVVESDLGDFEAALPLARQSHEAIRNYHNTGYFWTVWVTGFELALILRQRGDVEEALRIEREFAPMIAQTGMYHSFGAVLRLRRLGDALIAAGRFEPAEAILGECERVVVRIGPKNWRLAVARSARGRCLLGMGQVQKGEALMLEGVERLQADSAAPPAELRGVLEQAIEWLATPNGIDPEREVRVAEWRRRLAEIDAPRTPGEDRRR